MFYLDSYLLALDMKYFNTIKSGVALSWFTHLMVVIWSLSQHCEIIRAVTEISLKPNQVNEAPP